LLDEGARRGVTPPQVCLRDVPRQVEAHLADDPLSNPDLVAFAATPDAVQAEALGVVRSAVAPAYERLRAFLVDRYLPACRETTAFSALPDGDAWYRHLVRAHTTTDLPAQHIHEIGLREVE